MAYLRTKSFLGSIFSIGNTIVVKLIGRAIRDRSVYRRVDFARRIGIGLAILDTLQAIVLAIICIDKLYKSKLESTWHDDFRCWILGYMIQCILLVVWIFVEQYKDFYRKLSEKTIRYIEKGEVIVYRCWLVLGFLMLMLSGTFGGPDQSPQLHTLVKILVFLDIVILMIVFLVYLVLAIMVFFGLPLIFGYFHLTKDRDHKDTVEV
ncbi:hypothetical protein ACJIZ3_005134 [Penstemon smallii]|uniref:Transmembrane protein n=1 Tax=Penstemon smallii TaxID=265156 RepID=A0ABD3S409_9LAMI